ncbi:16S rRNA (cytosine(1402)-N(4))-methyltransferase RsmH [Pseudoclavibacter endophyticus]|uniref:Ribosomal RNA small subunit methyltransferase H n=1 Tax=Pseudoclavibacter endophyticus TaxID=1778590 RepID=A0A6H9WN24_9MICO|nr:16S rRNA (cytosine(1402)-N(4))-methyltransferase RsmH [Pseudoclavibacter endophyticus]KAB1650583.1 16S rRNA (cytosine(1402)-N(4))-methyltransferase RsmH [Pseudoclavibacter endophyticus]
MTDSTPATPNGSEADRSHAAADVHVPVLRDRCVDLLAPALEAPGAVVVDATLGMGGHAEALLERCPTVRLVGFDRDTDALDLARRRLERFGDRASFVHAVFDELEPALDDLGISAINGVLFDLGVSSLQLDQPERGFSYARDAPLDMRMDQSAGTTAADILASYTEAELRDLFYRYGDEKLAPRYASRIVAARERAPIRTTAALVDVLQAATPAALRASGHPAKRVFQALRVEVNSELAAIERAVPAAMRRLAVGGRIVVMSYQSLEDRLVKRFFQRASTSTAPARLPVELPEHRPEFALLVRGAERAGESEAAMNPRAIPVRLRGAERVLRHES